MIDYSELYESLLETPAKRWVEPLKQTVPDALSIEKHGNLKKWFEMLDSLPELQTSEVDLDIPQVRIGSAEILDIASQKQLEDQLRTLMPWRKGPYSLFGIDVDTEWRSNMKWDRLAPHISSLKDKLVLDVGCGSGYHCFRMLGEGAERVVGIDPTLLFVMQFYSLKHFTPQLPIDVLPVTLDCMPENLCGFDTVFSMGVLYHRRSPIDHLVQLRDALQPGGELILETMITDGPLGYSLTPETTYAGMKNVWFIPSPATLTQWLERCGFVNVRLVDDNRTTAAEQRPTSWMTGRSLADTLAPDNPLLTIEGLPTPKRGLFIAQRRENS